MKQLFLLLLNQNTAVQTTKHAKYTKRQRPFFSALCGSPGTARPTFWKRLRRSVFFVVLIAFFSALISSTHAETNRVPIAALAFSPDKASLCIGGYGALRVHPFQVEEKERLIRCDFPQVRAIAFSPQGKIVAIGGGDAGSSGSLQLVEFATGQKIAAASDFSDLVTSLAFNPEGTRLAAASADGTVQVFEISAKANELKRAFKLAQHSGPVLAVAYSPNGNVVVTASADRTLKVWRADSGALLRTLTHHTGRVNAIAVRPFETGQEFALCASASDDKTVRVWQPETGRMVRIVRQHKEAIFALAYTREGSQLLSAGEEGIVRIIDAESDQVFQEVKAHDDWIYSLAISPDGRRVATGDWVGRVRLWKIENGKLIPEKSDLSGP